MAYFTYATLKRRTAYLRGETDYTSSTSSNTIIQDHILFAVQDVANFHNWSWSIKKTTITLASGTANLPSDFNVKWGIEDARIVQPNTQDDQIFIKIPLTDRDNYSSSDYTYWLTYDTTNKVWVFNSTTLTGTVTIHYYSYPADLVLDADVLTVPDGEAVAYLAASKMWIGDERNVQLKQDYEQEATSRLTSLKQADLIFLSQYMPEGSVVTLNSGLVSR